MKRINGFWIIGITMLAMASIPLWPGSASALSLPLSLTISDGTNTATIYDNGTVIYDGAPSTSLPSSMKYADWYVNRSGYIAISTPFDNWQIYEIATSSGPGASPALLSLISVDSGPAGSKLSVTVSQGFTTSSTDPSLIGNISVNSTYNNTAGMNFTTTVGTQTDALTPAAPGQFTLGATTFGSLTPTYTATLEYDLTSGGNDPQSRVDNYSVSIATPEPATLLLLGTGLVGLAGLGALRRR